MNGMTRSILVFFTALLIVSLPAPVLEAQTSTLAGLDDWIEAERERWGIPGLAVAVVQGDEVIYSRGFGVKKLGERDPVDENTLFGIASVSKAFTASTLR